MKNLQTVLNQFDKTTQKMILDKVSDINNFSFSYGSCGPGGHWFQAKKINNIKVVDTKKTRYVRDNKNIVTHIIYDCPCKVVYVNIDGSYHKDCMNHNGDCYETITEMNKDSEVMTVFLE